MEDFEIVAILTHAEYQGEGLPLRQFGEVTIRLPKDFDFAKHGAALLKRLAHATELIGKGE